MLIAFLFIRELKYTRELLTRYRKALDTAVKIATRHNIKPIHGKTYLYCDVGPQMDLYAGGTPGVKKVEFSFLACLNFLVFWIF